MAATFNSPADYFKADGSYNVAFIMALAHAKARADTTLAISVMACEKLQLGMWSPRGKRSQFWNAEDAAFVATLAPELIRDIRADRGFPRYAALLADALRDHWHAARVWKSRGEGDKVRRAAEAAAAPIALPLAA